ncbi:MAG: 5-formyltetrahydrofolate cyclo-ligase [Bacteroidetes bacterium]|nr:MAG: 5-formyltetrahydrofolate cyclo-ligase [Bacteroidota bacterium]
MEKAELRSKYKKLRAKLAPGQLQQISEDVCHHLLVNYKLENKFVSLFLPIERNNELNTYLIWEKLKSFGAKVAVPKANHETGDLKHILFEQEEQLELSDWGIPEPKKGKVIAADRFQYVFVPLLALDEKGFRVGYGKGFYDRFLKKCAPSCRFIGLHHFHETEMIEDLLPTDVKLHACITPKGILRFE